MSERPDGSKAKSRDKPGRCSPEVRKLLDAQDWDDLGRRGEARELKLALRCGVRLERTRFGAATHRAIIMLYAGRRDSKVLEVGVAAVFFRLIRTLVLDACRLIREHGEVTGADHDAAADASTLTRAASGAAPPAPIDDLFGTLAHAATANGLLDLIETSCAAREDAEELLAVLHATRHDKLETPAEIASRLDIRESQVHARRKRLIRMLKPDALRARLGDEATPLPPEAARAAHELLYRWPVDASDDSSSGATASSSSSGGSSIDD